MSDATSSTISDDTKSENGQKPAKKDREQVIAYLIKAACGTGLSEHAIRNLEQSAFNLAKSKQTYKSLIAVILQKTKGLTPSKVEQGAEVGNEVEAVESKSAETAKQEDFLEFHETEISDIGEKFPEISKNSTKLQENAEVEIGKATDSGINPILETFKESSPNTGEASNSEILDITVGNSTTNEPTEERKELIGTESNLGKVFVLKDPNLMHLLAQQDGGEGSPIAQTPDSKKSSGLTDVKRKIKREKSKLNRPLFLKAITKCNHDTFHETFQHVRDEYPGLENDKLFPPIRSPLEQQEVSHVLKREIAYLGDSFNIIHDPYAVGRNLELVCYLENPELPAVPPIYVSIPPTYPDMPPECTLLDSEYGATDFLRGIREKLVHRVNNLSEWYTLTHILNMWEVTVKQACNGTVNGNTEFNYFADELSNAFSRHFNHN